MVLNRWMKLGVPSRFIDRAGRRWGIDTYARTVIQSTTYRTFNDMRTRAAEDLGINTFYYSVESAARPACAPLQGKILTKGQGFFSPELGENVESLHDHGWGDPSKVLGINCRHTLTPFVIGANTKPDLPEELANLTPEEAIANGQKQAQQRALERSLRDAKYRLEGAKLAGDTRRITHFQNRIKDNNLALRQLVRENPFLFRDTTRERIFSDGRAQGFAFNFATRNATEYNRIRNILGHRAPSFNEFQRLSNNDILRLRDNAHVVNKLNSGEWGRVINRQKQVDHNFLTRKAGKSYLLEDVDAQQLFNKYAGTGILEKTRAGSRTTKERIMTDENIGFDFRLNEKVKGFKIHHSARRTHIVPWIGE